MPAAGRQGHIPQWPLSRPSQRELAIWAQEWTRPQAVMWERNRQHQEVALYVRTLVEAERRGAPAALRTLVRQQQEALGISLTGMLRLRWLIAAEGEERPRLVAEAGPSVRERLRSG